MAVLRHVEVNGVHIGYTEHGSGIPVVFVHGSMSDRRIWEAQRPDIALNYRYVAYDQRYFGPEPWRDDGRNFSQATHAADLMAFIRSLHAGPVHVVAWSYGGSVATLAASQHPELFRSLSLHEPTHRQPERQHARRQGRRQRLRRRSGAHTGDANAGDATVRSPAASNRTLVDFLARH